MNIGDTVSVVVKNPIWKFRKAYASYLHIPEFNTYTGTICPPTKGMDPTAVFLTTGDKHYPIRVIDRERIVSVGGKPIESVKITTKTFTISGSKGNKYTVTKDGNHLSCTCTGFSFRRQCKHVNEVKEKMAA